MFTGIIESSGIVKQVISNGSNRSFWISSPLSDEFVIDQSISHNGVCLTVEETRNGEHRVTAVKETLEKTNLSNLRENSIINLERCLTANSRVDGHFVQGHVDTVGTCIKRKEEKGSVDLEFTYPGKFAALVIEKGSVCVNGISLTSFAVKKKSFKVTIIPYTLEHSNIKEVQKGSTVNLEFDLIGKYIVRYLSLK